MFTSPKGVSIITLSQSNVYLLYHLCKSRQFLKMIQGQQTCLPKILDVQLCLIYLRNLMLVRRSSEVRS